MAEHSEQIFVRSHVARDLLQNAAFFRTDRLVVWEYVSNGLDYVDDAINPEVRVTLDTTNRRIVIDDNGRGMDWAGLKNFFIMHGENIDRKMGRAGRGRFGTGKSAAFGIGDVLRITTVRNGRRSKVELNRKDILKLDSEGPIPVKPLEKEARTSQRNGTRIEIEKIHLNSFDRTGIIKFIEHHLARWPSATVFVDSHECEFQEPFTREERRYRPEGKLKERLGEAELVIKIAKAVVDEDLRGISIYSNGVWHATTYAGSEGREMSQFIFGEIDVPALDSDESAIPPFDASRSMQLNLSNDLVQAIYTFIGQKVEEARKELVKSERQRKESEEARKLDHHANEIARLINEDFQEFRNRVARAKAGRATGFDLGTVALAGQGPEDAESLLLGGDIPAKITEATGNPSSAGNHGGGRTEPMTPNPQVELPPNGGEKRGRATGGKESTVSGRGGFKVDFTNAGPEEKRARYDSAARIIYINLDHPQLVAARGPNSIEEPFFSKLTYEIAFTEYAVALAYEMVKSGWYADATDVIVEIRETINRVAKKAARIFVM